jgi:hypothetical protein
MSQLRSPERAERVWVEVVIDPRCECGHLASEHAEGYVCVHLLDDPDDGWHGVCPCVRRDESGQLDPFQALPQVSS